MNSELSREELSGKLDRLVGMLQADPGNIFLRRQCVDMATSLARFDVIVQVADSALKANSVDATALFDRATGLIGRRDYRGALEALEKLESLVDQNVAVHLNAALCLYCLGEFSGARPRLEFCYRSGSRDAGFLRLLVSTYHHLGATADAVAIANDNGDAAASDGALAGVYALLYLDAGDVARATHWAKTALDLNPRSIDGRVTQATLLTARAQLDDARRMLEGVLADAPSTGRAWIGLGALSLLSRDMVAAKSQISRGLEFIPSHTGSWHVLAWAHVLSGDLDAAERTFETALAADRNFSESHGGLGVIAAMRGDKVRAEQYLKAAQRLDPECVSAKFVQAVLSANTDPARAQSIIRATLGELSVQDSSALSQLLTKVSRH